MPEKSPQAQIEHWVSLENSEAQSAALDECRRMVRRDERMLRAVIASLDAEQAKVKLFAMHVLIDAADLGLVKEAIPKLARIVEQGGEDGTRLTAATTLGEIGKPAIATLGRFLQHEDPDIRSCAASGLSRNIPDRVEAISYLIQAFEDENEDVRSSACESIEFFQSKAIPFLQKLVADKRPRSSIFAIHLLAKLAPELVADQRDTLVPRLEHSDPVVREEALATIRDMQLQTPEVAEAVAQRLDDSADAVRLEAAETLAKFPELPDEVAPALGRAANEDTELTPRYAVQALARMGTKARAALPMLIQAVSSEDEYVRRDVIAILRVLGPKAQDALPALEKAAREFPDDGPLIRKAIKAIRQ